MNEAERHAEDPKPTGTHYQPPDQPERRQFTLVAVALVIAIVIGGAVFAFIRYR